MSSDFFFINVGEKLGISQILGEDSQQCLSILEGRNALIVVTLGNRTFSVNVKSLHQLCIGLLVLISQVSESIQVLHHQVRVEWSRSYTMALESWL